MKKGIIVCLLFVFPTSFGACVFCNGQDKPYQIKKGGRAYSESGESELVGDNPQVGKADQKESSSGNWVKYKKGRLVIPFTENSARAQTPSPSSNGVTSALIDAKSRDGVCTKPYARNYTWESDGLKGHVKKVTQYYTNNQVEWTKSFDRHGRLTAFSYSGIDRIYIMHSLFPDYFYSEYSILKNWDDPCLFFLNPVLSVYYPASRDELSPTAVFVAFQFEYNKDGLVSKVYADPGDNHYVLLYRFEYDDRGRVIKRYYDEKPTVRVEWEDRNDSGLASFTIFTYSLKGYQTGKTKYENRMGGLYREHNNTVFKMAPDANPSNFENKVVEMTREVLTHYYYTYNPDGSMREIAYLKKGRGGDTHIDTEFRYNSNGDIIEQIKCEYFEPNKNALGDYSTKKSYWGCYHWDYEYDQHGNATKITTFKITRGDIDIETINGECTKEYEYYE